MENMHRCHVSDSPPPFSVYVLIILLLLLLLFVVHQFAGLCSQQKQMGNICPGRPGPPPGPRVSVCPQLSLALRAVALLLYLDKPFFRDCRTQQGPCGPPACGAEGQPGRGEEARCVPGLPGKPGSRTCPSRSSCQAQPRPHLPVLLSFAER